MLQSCPLGVQPPFDLMLLIANLVNDKSRSPSTSALSIGAPSGQLLQHRSLLHVRFRELSARESQVLLVW